jgi:tetratricopeptide (TPR) repeat protein
MARVFKRRSAAHWGQGESNWANHNSDEESSRDVFAKRKAGELDEAYQLAIKLVANDTTEKWTHKALAWCLIDLIKRDSQKTDQSYLASYVNQLQAIEVEASDEILSKQVTLALSLCNPNGQLIQQAKTLSRQGNHTQAANIYRKLCVNGAGDQDVQTSLGWELFRLLQQATSQDNLNLGSAKRLLADYLKLGLIEKPSLLHSSILQLAAKLAGNSNFSFISFVRYWQLDKLRTDDYKPYINNKGDKYPSLAEKVIQQSVKEAVNIGDVTNINYILPYVNDGISRFPENLWLKLNKAKALMKLGQHDQALSFAIDVTRSKVNDYWAWDLLGDVNAELNELVSLSCYCKALLCHSEDKFTGKVRLKLAKHMSSQGEFSEAKHEIEHVISSKTRDRVKIPQEVEGFRATDWYDAFPAAESNTAYYQSNCAKAEELLFSQLPFCKACIGDKYTISDKPNKPKRKLYIRVPKVTEPFEVSVPENKYKFGRVSSGLNVKGDFDASGRFQVFLIEDRKVETDWDIFAEYIGVVDHVNHQKRVIHFIVNRTIGGVIDFSDIQGKLHTGNAIAVRVAQFNSKQGVKYKTISAQLTEKEPSNLIYKAFTEKVRESNGMGFTDNDIFIDPSLMSKHRIEDDARVSGMAVLNYNKKRGEWGWKALKIKSVASFNE